MKKILLLLVTVLLLGSFVDLQAQAVNDWSWSHPRPVGATLICLMPTHGIFLVITEILVKRLTPEQVGLFLHPEPRQELMQLMDII